MRPVILFPLFASLTTLKGVGAKLAPLYMRLFGEKIVDVLWHLPIGVIDRTNLTGVDEIRKQLEPYGYKVYAVKANPDYLHLDMCFNLVAPKLAIAYEAGLPEDFVTLVKEKGIKIISGTQDMIFKHGYNVEALGNNRVMSLKQNTFINEALRSEGMEVIEVDMMELLKAGGGVHCMTFPLERY